MGWSGTASAEKKRVGVPRFDGPQEAIVRKAVMQVLRGNYDVVGAKELDAAAKSTGAQLDSNGGFKAVAKELGISSFVTGEVSKKKAKLTVRNGADGSVNGEGAFGGANPNKVAADVRNGFSRRLGSAVERGRAPSGAKKPAAAPAPVAVDEGEDNGAAAGGEDEAPARTSKAAVASKADDKGDKDDKDDDKDKNDKSDKNDGEAPPSSGAGPEETVAKKAPEPESDSGAPGPRALDLGVGFGGFNRSLSYNQDLYGTLRQYKLALGPAATLKVLLFPASFSSAGFIANLGLELNIEQAFGVTSSVPANPSGTFPMGATFNTIVHDYYGGARFRLVLAGGHELALAVGGGEHAFSFRDGPNATDARSMLNIPDTIYRYVRIGVDTRFELPGGVTLGLGAGYRQILNSAGQISDAGFFPYLTVRGVDLDATLGYHITPSIEGRLNANLRRYFYAMNSSPDKCNTGCDFNSAGMQVNSVAGGAVDQYLGFSVGAAYIFGGASRGASSGEEEPEAAPAPKKKKGKKKKSSDDDDDDKGGGGDDNGGGGGSSDE